MTSFLTVNSGWNRNFTVPISEGGQDANAAFTFQQPAAGTQFIGMAAFLPGDPAGCQVDAVVGSYDSPADTGGGNLRIVIGHTSLDNQGFLNAAFGLPWQIGVNWRTSATDHYKGPAVPNIEIPSILDITGAILQAAQPNGLVVIVDHANGADPYGDVKIGQSVRGQTDGVMTFGPRGIPIPPNRNAFVLWIAYRQRTELGDPVAAEKLAGQFLRGSVIGGPVPALRNPTTGAIVPVTDAAVSLARFLATVSPPSLPAGG